MSNNIHTGQQVVWQDTTYLIRAIKPELGDLVLEAKGGVERSVDIYEFYNRIAAGEIVLPHHKIEVVERAITASEQAEADFRQELVELMDKLEQQQLDGPTRKMRIDTFCHMKGHKCLSNKTLKGYQQTYHNHGALGLVPNFSRRGGSGWTKKRAAKEVAEEVLIKTFMTDDKLNLSKAVSAVSDALDARKEEGTLQESIDRKTIARVLLSLPPSLVKEGRLDPRTFNLYSRQAVKCYDVKMPFERVEIDAKTIGMYYRDEYGNLCTELTLYAMVCSCTSYPIAVYVCAGKPSEYTLLKLFEFFFAPKDQAFRDMWGIQTDWVQPCGIKQIVLDNASENASELALSIVRRLGIQIEYARIARGDDKPHVESFFKAIDDALFNLMPGAHKSQDKRIKNRHARAMEEACYSVDDIYQSLVRFIADVYIHRPNVKLGFKHGQPMSIKMAMDEAIKKIMPVPPPSLEQVKRLILNVNRTSRMLQHYGVDFEGFRFHSDAMASLARERNISRLDILYNPEDCMAVYAVHPDDDSLIRLENKTVGMPSVSFSVAKYLHGLYSRPGEVMTGHDYQKAYAEMRARFAADSRKPKKIKENNKAQRQSQKSNQKSDIAEQIEKRVPQTTIVTPLIADSDDDFLPAPRQERSHDC